MCSGSRIREEHETLYYYLHNLQPRLRSPAIQIISITLTAASTNILCTNDAKYIAVSGKSDKICCREVSIVTAIIW